MKDERHSSRLRPPRRAISPVVAAAALCLSIVWSSVASAEDWPEFRGKGRRGVWAESGILESFPADGLTIKTIKWRTPINAGYAGPAVSEGRVFVVDFTPAGTEDPEDAPSGSIGGALSLYRGTERVLALDEETGDVLWTRLWPVDYAGIMWAIGPRATSTATAYTSLVQRDISWHYARTMVQPCGRRTMSKTTVPIESDGRGTMVL